MTSPAVPARPSRNFVDPRRPPLVIGLMRASLWFDESLRLLQGKHGFPVVTRPQTMVLAHLAAGERRAVRIARLMGVTRQAVSVLINDLVHKGVVVVEKDPEDARAQLLDFSPETAAQSTQLLDLFRLLEEHLGDTIGQDRLGVLRQALAMDWGEPVAPAP